MLHDNSAADTATQARLPAQDSITLPGNKKVHVKAPKGAGGGGASHPGYKYQAAGHNGRLLATRGSGSSCSSCLSFHGGAVLSQPIDLFLVFYGDKSFGNSTTPTPMVQLIKSFVDNLAATPWWARRLSSSYPGSATIKPATAMRFAGATYFAASATNAASPRVPASYTFGGAASGCGAAGLPACLGTSLSDANVETIVSYAVGTGALGATTLSPTAFYFVVTSSEVKESSGSCSIYCAWHKSDKIGTVTFAFGVVIDPTSCMSSCAWQTTSPNKFSAAANAMLSMFAHELSEAVTDPSLATWYNSRSGNENADTCAWTFSPTYTAPGFLGVANMVVGGVDVLIQRSESASPTPSAPPQTRSSSNLITDCDLLALPYPAQCGTKRRRRQSRTARRARQGCARCPEKAPGKFVRYLGGVRRRSLLVLIFGKTREE